MKRYSLIVALHIIGIAFLSVGVYLLVDAGLWFSALMAFLILLAIAVHLYRLQMMQVRMMRHLAESLRYDDMMLSFRSPYKNRSMEDMVDELSEAMRNFRTRVLERNEMEAWQKLIRVLTHEIMNSITPIISLSETLSEREMSEKNYPVMRQGMQTIHRRRPSSGCRPRAVAGFAEAVFGRVYPDRASGGRPHTPDRPDTDRTSTD